MRKHIQLFKKRSVLLSFFFCLRLQCASVWHWRVDSHLEEPCLVTWRGQHRFLYHIDLSWSHYSCWQLGLPQVREYYAG